MTRELTDAFGQMAADANELEQIREEHARFRKALVKIANANSGRWGWIAHEALHPKKVTERDIDVLSRAAVAPAPKDEAA